MERSNGDRVRERMARLLRSLRAEDLEERIAPVKCAKHPDHPDCYADDYGVPLYLAPSPPGEPGAGPDPE
jgi:hypothetical protein